MRKIMLCLLIAVFSCGYYPSSVHAFPCDIDPATGQSILNSPPNCTPKTQQSSPESPKNQPATDTETAPKTPLEEAREAEARATEAHAQAETSYQQQQETVESLANEVQKLNSYHNNTTTEPDIDDFSTMAVTEREKSDLLRKLQSKQEALSGAKADLESKKKFLDQAEQEKKDKSKAAAEAEREEDRKKQYLNHKDFLKGLEEKRKEIVGQAISLPDMGVTIGSEITTTKDLFANVIKFLSRAIGTVAVLSIMIGGIILTISSGDEDLQAKAKDIILYSVLATVLVLAAYAIISGIMQVIYSLGK